jgi:hypothetical protein
MLGIGLKAKERESTAPCPPFMAAIRSQGSPEVRRGAAQNEAVGRVRRTGRGPNDVTPGGYCAARSVI